MVAKPTRRAAQRSATPEKASIGISGLDEITFGGLPRGRTSRSGRRRTNAGSVRSRSGAPRWTPRSLRCGPSWRSRAPRPKRRPASTRRRRGARRWRGARSREAAAPTPSRSGVGARSPRTDGSDELIATRNGSAAPAPGAGSEDHWRLTLYIAGQTPKSVAAIANLRGSARRTLPAAIRSRSST